jgi:two-component system sensor histidine kinase/response regulator
MKLILLIDDDEFIRTSFGIALRSRGHQVIEAETGEAGLELARQQMPDLILSDIHMPGLDGQDLLRHIRADPKLSSKQVVLMTGRPDLVPLRKGMEQGADDFLVKPITLQALIACVDSRLNRADLHWRVEGSVVSKLQSSMTSQLPHELITPLAGILGLSELLQADFANLSPEEMQDFHKDIHQSAMRLHRTVRNYLLMLELEPDSAPTTESLEPLPPSKLKECIETAVNMGVERHGRKTDIDVNWKYVPILVRPPDLTHIIEELVDNAFKFSRNGTSIKVTLDESGALLVTDEGRGMSEEEIAHIGAFRQFDRKKYEQQGLGLGLVLVQQFVQRNGAKFSLTKRAEKGMEARVNFKRKDAGNS